MVSHRVLSACLILTVVSACGRDGSDETTATPSRNASAERPSGNGVCGLLTQGEVDEIFGVSVGAGTNESLDGDVELCSWPADQDPALLLQISPAGPDIRAAVDLGDGFRVVELAEMSGPSAAAVEEADGDGSVAVLAMSSGNKTITISPIGLGLKEDSPKFTRLRELVDLIATRL